MKQYTLRFAQKNEPTFNAIRTGKKRVETRAASPKYQNIQPGDVVFLICGNRKFKKTVKQVTVFKSIEKLVGTYEISDINPFINNLDELKAKYYSFPNYKEKIKKFGLVALEFD